MTRNAQKGSVLNLKERHKIFLPKSLSMKKYEVETMPPRNDLVPGRSRSIGIQNEVVPFSGGLVETQP